MVVGACTATKPSAAPHNSYRGTSLIRNNPYLGTYSRLMPKVVGWSYGGGGFL